jgi:hypothetical protein
MFVRNIDGSSYMKTTDLKIFDLLESFVQEIGEENIGKVLVTKAATMS